MSTIEFTPLLYVALAINGLFTGLGCALGSYVAQKHIITKTNKLIGRIRKQIARIKK